VLPCGDIFESPLDSLLEDAAAVSDDARDHRPIDAVIGMSRDIAQITDRPPVVRT
jgi:hypothetical protein